MFQTFDGPEALEHSSERVQKLRALMVRGGLDAVLVPRADEHQGEYVAPASERLAWLTGFTGSAGLAIVGKTSGALFVDSRYTVQARAQTERRTFEVLQVPEAKPSEWLVGKLSEGAVVGFDPWLHTESAVEELTKVLEDKAIKLKPLAANPVDRIWGRDRPAPPANPVVPHPLRYAGKSFERKLSELQDMLRAESVDAVLLTQPDSIAWLLNIRGSDVAHNPVALAFAIVPATGKAELFIDPVKIGPEAKAHLAGLVKICEPVTIERRMLALKDAGKRVKLDPGTAASWFFRRLKGKARIVRGADPCTLPKARKNATEIKGARAAHKRDGVAVTRFLAWLDREAPSGTIDEITAARRLETMRSETQALKEISFDTISGSGPHGAIVHYRVTTATNRELKPGELFLVDSGAQYIDGTTDITRTVAIGAPTFEMQERFTLVLKGHIAIAAARFPKGTRGVDLDPFARRALWAAGLDYGHGTGHGIGSYLSVHEGPQSISKRGTVPLEPGMIISNEPGYYKEGAYGIRIENLVLVSGLEQVEGGEQGIMSFETLTLAPMDRRLIVVDMLSAEELAWLDTYHALVAEVIGPELGPADRAWLEQATAPIK